MLRTFVFPRSPGRKSRDTRAALQRDGELMLGHLLTAPDPRHQLRSAPRAAVARTLGRCHGGRLSPHPPAGVCPQKKPPQPREPRCRPDPSRAPARGRHGGRSCGREPPAENREPRDRSGTALLNARIPAGSPGGVITGAAVTTASSPPRDTAAGKVKPPSSQVHTIDRLNE